MMSERLSKIELPSGLPDVPIPDLPDWRSLSRDLTAALEQRNVENESLRALNAELLTTAKQYLSRLETLCGCAESSGCKDAARRAALKDLIARAETAS